MTQEHATVKSHVSGEDRGLGPAEALRLQFADAWGDMSASWGVAPAIGRVHAYLMVRGVPLTEREVREALGLSHRAASLALADAEAWGIVERVSEPRRSLGRTASESEIAAATTAPRRRVRVAAVERPRSVGAARIVDIVIGPSMRATIR